MPNSVTAIQTEIMFSRPGINWLFVMYLDFQYDFGTSGMGGQKFQIGSNPLGNTSTSLIYMHPTHPTHPTSDAIGGHAVIVGWGSFRYKEYMIPYWTCLNSWSVKWGTSGVTSSQDRMGPPLDQSRGGYFYFVRGLNNCEIQNNVVVGQPDVDNITFKGVPDQYGWGLPNPNPNDVTYIPENVGVPIDMGSNDVLVFKTSIPGGGAFSNRVQLDPEQLPQPISGYFATSSPEPGKPLYSWSVDSVEENPYTFFWPARDPFTSLDQ